MSFGQYGQTGLTGYPSAYTTGTLGGYPTSTLGAYPTTTLGGYPGATLGGYPTATYGTSALTGGYTSALAGGYTSALAGAYPSTYSTGFPTTLGQTAWAPSTYGTSPLGAGRLVGGPSGVTLPSQYLAPWTQSSPRRIGGLGGLGGIGGYTAQYGGLPTTQYGTIGGQQQLLF